MKSVDEKIKKLLKLRERGDWLDFMDFVLKEMSFLLKSGRPARHEVQESLIGQAGCDSWEQFCVEKLNWSKPGWHAWTQAYRMVLKYPYLLEAEASASLINVRRRQLSTFPATLEDWQKISSDKSASNHKSKIAQLDKRLTELESLVSRLMCGGS